MPLKATLCGLPVALSAIDSVPVRVPVAVGMKVTDTVQLAPVARLLPQLLVCEKSPVVETEVMLRLADPLFVTVTVCAALVVFTVWLAKLRLTGDSDTEGVGALVPVPLSATLCGLPVALSAIDSVPVRVPVVVGLKVTLTEQFDPAARVLPQVFVCEKSPVAETDVMLKLAVPVFEIVMVWAALDVFTTRLPNVRLFEDSDTAGAGALAPVPLSATLCGLPVALSAIENVPVRVPVAVGVKMTDTVQLDPAATLLPQLFVCEKSPVTEIEVMLKLAVPVLLTVNVCA